MWEELRELLLGLVGAGIVLAALYHFVARVQADHAERVGEEDAGRDQPPAPAAHQALTLTDEDGPASPERRFPGGTPPTVAALYICAEAGAPMRRVQVVDAIAGKGLKDDRYATNRGHWSESDECEVTLIAREDLDQAMQDSGLSLRDGRHRRNIETRGIDLASLRGRRFRIGGAWFSAARPRPPCLYLQKLTEPGFARALVGRGGIGVHCFGSGPIREGDPIMVLDHSIGALLRQRWRRWVTRNGAGKAGARPADSG